MEYEAWKHTFLQLVKMMYRLRMSGIDVGDISDFLEVMMYITKWEEV